MKRRKQFQRLLKSPIVKTMLGGFLLVIIPTLMIGLVSNTVAIKTARDEIINSYTNSIKLVSQQMEDHLYNMDMLSASFMLDDSAIALSNAGKEENNLFDYVQFSKKMQLYRTQQFLNMNMVLCFPKQNWAVSTNSGVFRLSDLKTTFQLDSLTAQDTIWSIKPSFLSPSQDYLCVIRGYVHADQSNPFVILEFEGKELRKVLSTMSYNASGLQTFFVDPLGNYTYTGNVLGEDVQKVLEEYFTKGNYENQTFQNFRVGGKNYRFIYQTMGSYNCRLGMLFEASDMLRPVLNIQVFLIVFMIFAVLASLFFVVNMYRKIVTPTRELVSAMGELESGNMAVRVEIDSKNEFTAMSRQFNKMVQQLDVLIKDSYLKELKLKNAQLRFLRSQINPHFLYNSLFSLYNMIQNDELEGASKMAVYLGRYYQRSAHLHEKELTIAEEIENIEMYIQIMSIRFPHKLLIHTEIHENTLGLSIPALSLQTIVENAVLHGMEDSETTCSITIKAFLSGEILFLSVTDTGKGFTQEQLEKIQKRLSASVDAQDRHGLENVYMRLRLMYGDAVSFHITNQTPQGAKIEIEIPYREDTENV